MPANRSSARPPDGRRERWRAHREARRAELITAVVDVVRARGAGIGMDDVASASGVAKPVFYRYFTDKADLYLAVGRSVADAVVMQVIAAVEGQRAPRERLAAGIDTYLRTVEREPELYRFVVRSGHVAPRTGEDPVSDYTTVVSMHVTRVVGDLLRAVGLDAGPAEPWSFGLVGLVRAAADRWLEAPSMSRAALTGYLTELLWTGFAGAYAAAGLPVDTLPRHLPAAARAQG